MNGHASRATQLSSLLPSLIAICALALGLGIGRYGPTAVLPVLAVLGAIVVFFKPVLAVAALAAVIPVENVIALEGGVFTGARLLGVVVFMVWMARKIVLRESFGHLGSILLLPLTAGFVCLALASSLWATDSRIALRGALQLAQLWIWCVLVIDLIRSWRDADVLAKALVIGGFMAAGLTLQQSLMGARRAGEMIAGGVNATAVVLLALIPFGFYLLRSQRSGFWRFLGLGYVGLGIVGIVLTFSRMSLLLLPPLLLALSWDTLRGGRGRLWLGCAAAIAVIVAVTVVPRDRLQARVSSIVPYIQRTVAPEESTDPTSSGRGYHLRVGLEIARDHPIVGVGYNNYGELFLTEYQYSVPGMARIYSTRRSPHSSFVGILADLGLVGLAIWLLILSIALRNAWHGWRATRRWRQRGPHALVQAVTYAVALHATALGLYLPNQKDKLFWTFLALSSVVYGLSRIRPAPRSAST